MSRLVASALAGTALLVALTPCARATSSRRSAGERGAAAQRHSLATTRGLLLRRRTGPQLSGPLAARRSCRAAGAGLVQCLPDIIFAGQSKAGTTSVSRALAGHPAVDLQRNMDMNNITGPGGKAFDEEAHIFDYHRRSRDALERRHWATAPVVTEARAGSALLLQYTPNYMYYPDAPLNILEVYPNARSIKYIFMLREPVQRAVSSYKFHKRVTLEMRSLEGAMRDGMRQRRALEACYAEQLPKGGRTAKRVDELPPREMRQVLDTCFWKKRKTHDTTVPPELPMTLMHGHVDKSVYVDQLRRWFSLVGRENCFVFSLEEWMADAHAVFSKMTDFVGLEMVGPLGYPSEEALNQTLSKRLNKISEDSDSPRKKDKGPPVALLEELQEFYRPYNQALFELIGRNLW